MVEQETIRAIIDAGVKAPSGDNMQPWRFEVENNQINVFIAPTTDDESMLNRAYYSTHLAHGALIENMLIAAAHLGYTANVDMFPDSTNQRLTARIKLVESNTQYSYDKSLYSYITNRCTNRAPYFETPISEEQKNELLRAIDGLDLSDKHRIIFVDGSRGKKRVARNVVTQVNLLLSHETFHREFFSTLRWNNAEAQQNSDGLDIATLELKFHERFFMKYILRHWQVAHVLNALGSHAFFAFTESLRYSKAGSYLGFIGPTRLPEEEIMAGRAMERLWLTATRLGVAVQPAFATYLLGENIGEKYGSIFSAKQDALLRKNIQNLDALFGVEEDERMLFMLRLGIPRRDVIRSYRKQPTIEYV